MKRLLKSKCGMSLMEILVALSLLMIVIVGTTPVMLQAYDGLYTAGEYTQNVYNAKTEVEDQLATRSSTLNYKGFKVNFEGLGEVAKVNAKRAVSSLKTSLETLFTGARVRIYISSGSVVDDNQSEHTLVLQTVNLAFTNNDITNEKMNNKAGVSKDGKKIDITAYLPNKAATANTAATVYTENRKAKVTVVNDTTNPDSGRIGIKISSNDYPIDFTTSPIKILVTYLDENDKVKSVHTYLTIKTPTIMIAGETNGNVQYYTTAGVVETKDNDGNVTNRTLKIEGRKMNIGYDTKTGARSDSLGAASTQVVPTGTVFKSINWITEYAKTTGGSGAGSENVEYANTCYEPEYYVLTGTNGVIYRTYSFTDPNTIRGKVSFSNSDDNFGLNGLLLNTYTGKNQIDKDVIGVQDTEIYLDDRASTVVYPAVWGGDFSHIFGWTAYGEEAGYVQRTNQNNTNGTWYTRYDSGYVSNASSTTGSRGTGSAGYYSNFACFGYFYNGWLTPTNYPSMKSRKISYILTEVPYSMRVGGYMKEVGSADKYGYDGIHFDRIWEQPNYADGSHINELTGYKIDANHTWNRDDVWAWFYAGPNSSMPRSSIVEAGYDGDEYEDSNRQSIPTYFVKRGDGTEGRNDNGFAQLRLKALTTLSPTIINERTANINNASDFRVATRNDINKSKITVTDAVYIPSATGGQGSIFYVGTVAAYGFINQVDNVGTNPDSPNVKGNRNKETQNTGRISSYLVVSNEDGTQTAVYKTSTKSDTMSIQHADMRNRVFGKAWPTTSITANDVEGKSRDFYISMPIETYKSTVFSDVSFTLGFTSNREMVYTNIVYGVDSNGNLKQSLKFCEPLYFQSHYDNPDKIPNLYMNSNVVNYSDVSTLTYNGVTESSLNSKHNDYYNVWFPGEMYNLTKTATKDNVTVAVGYAVAGSTYTYLNSKADGSTALGGIYNDGVISGMVLGQDTAFKNLLYYKDNASFDDDSLYEASTNSSYTYKRYGNNDTTGTAINAYKDLGWKYGTHARDSVQFTCVDISVVVSGDTTYYYAYYADNKGRIYRSLVATRGKDAPAATMVNYISDKSSSPGIEDVIYMEEQTFVVGEWTMKGSNYFEKINTIAAHDDLIVITGKSKSQTTWKVNILVGVIDKENPTAAPTWKLLTWGYENFVVHDALIRDGYLYLVGENSTSPCGFILAVPLDTLRSADSNSSISGIFEDNVNDHKLKFYAIAGKE